MWAMSHPRTVLPDPRRSPRFAGIATFARYPRLEDVTPENRPVDWAIYGVPYDTGVTYRPGARFGPRAIRDASAYLKRYSIAHGVDVCEALSLADAGDAPVKPFHPGECIEDVAAWAAGLGDSTTRLLALGGDHSIAYANIEATWRRCGSPTGGLALIHFDSHLDTVDSVWGERWSHASPFIRAIERGIINPRRMISIGIKGPLNTAGDLDFAREHGVTIVTREEWADAGPGTLSGFVRLLDDEPAYVTFDVDVIDPAFAPGTGTPSVGGFSSTEALAIVRSLAGVRVAGGDVVEVLPDRDVAQNTALLAAHVAFEILCLSAIHPR
ncbi:MAG: agmatinase [Leptolyngbya sp. PLA3]|nr:MAG: agmatinase [Cyanobacteria bacterium CYA]MCE7968675.1 agmatinase [Leptolyngbya sp. PL-A3]